MSRTITGLAVLIALLACACGDELESISEVTKFRVLAVRAEPPEISPGEGTSLSVLFADPEGDGREVRVFWIACAGGLSPTSNLQEACELVEAPQLKTYSEAGDRYEISPVRADILADLKEGETHLPVTVIVALCAGGELPSFEEIIGSGAVSEFDDLCKGGDGLVAVKKFRISELDASSRYRNVNPVITSMLYDRSPLLDAEYERPGVFQCPDSFGCRVSVEIEAFLRPPTRGAPCDDCEPCEDDEEPACSGCENGDFQHWKELRFGEETCVFDDPYISWFATGGTFSGDRSRPSDPHEGGVFRVSWRPPRYGGKFTMWAVAHDLRGGVSWKRYLIEARTAAVPE